MVSLDDCRDRERQPRGSLETQLGFRLGLGYGDSPASLRFFGWWLCWLSRPAESKQPPGNNQYVSLTHPSLNLEGSRPALQRHSCGADGLLRTGSHWAEPHAVRTVHISRCIYDSGCCSPPSAAWRSTPPPYARAPHCRPPIHFSTVRIPQPSYKTQSRRVGWIHLNRLPKPRTESMGGPRTFWKFCRCTLSGSTYSSKPSVLIAHSRSSPLMVLRFSR